MPTKRSVRLTMGGKLAASEAASLPSRHFQGLYCMMLKMLGQFRAFKSLCTPQWTSTLLLRHPACLPGGLKAYSACSRDCAHSETLKFCALDNGGPSCCYLTGPLQGSSLMCMPCDQILPPNASLHVHISHVHTQRGHFTVDF